MFSITANPYCVRDVMGKNIKKKRMKGGVRHKAVVMIAAMTIAVLMKENLESTISVLASSF